MQEEIDELRAENVRLWLEREEPHKTIQNYLHEVNSLEQERDELRAKLARTETALAGVKQDEAVLQSKLAALEAQEPVARFNWHLGKFEWLTKYNFAAHNMKPLFLAAADTTFNGKSAEYWNKLAVERWQENQKLEAKLAARDADIVDLCDQFGAKLDPALAQLEALKAQEPVVIRIRKHYPSGPADGNRRIGDWTYIDQGSVQYAKEQIAGADAIEKLYAAANAPTDEWKDAVLDALASHGMDAPLTDTPQHIVKKLTDMVATMARDPAINAPSGAAPVPRMTGAALASQEPVAEVLLVDGEKVIDASMAFFDSVDLGTKLYLAAGAAPNVEWNKNIRDSVDKLLEQAGYAEDSSARHQLAMMNFDSAGVAPAAKVPEEPRIDINDISGMIAAVIKEQP